MHLYYRIFDHFYDVISPKIAYFIKIVFNFTQYKIN